MERFTISKSKKQTIYEMYRSCRICGAGGGYRMPIIQNIIDLDSNEVELRQKIQECLQLEVRPDDRMPPLICELCVDKLNDFHQFLELSRQTNITTRTRLGLPLPSAKKGEPESSDCILGITEPVYVKEDDAKKTKAGPKCSKKIKKEPEVNVKVENASDSSRSSSASRSTRRAASPPLPPPPPRARRDPPAPAATPSPAPSPATRRRPDDTRAKLGKPETPKVVEAPNRVQISMKKELQTLLEDSAKYSGAAARAQKRTREDASRRVPPKRPRPPPVETPKDKEPTREPSPPRRPGPASRRPVRREPDPDRRPARTEPDPDAAPAPKLTRAKAKPETPAKAKDPPKPPPQESPPPAGPPFKCGVCDAQIKNAGGFTNHMRVHVPCFTKLSQACNPCGLWFPSPEVAAAHHRHHRDATFPYHCRRCFDDFRALPLYDDHIEKGLCVQDEPPHVKCEECGAMFADEQRRAHHKCAARAKQGGKCSKCSRTYQTAKTLKRHESQCVHRKGELIADPDVLRRLKPMRVRIARCDGLLERTAGEYCDVSRVKPNYGLAKNYIYPYMKLPPVKAEPLQRDSIVAIPVALKEELATTYTHWDSDDSDTDIIRRVPSLSTLAIKKLFSKNLLGKLPRKRRKVKNEEFDEYDDASNDINDIISGLGDLGNSEANRDAFTAKIKDIIGCLDDEADGYLDASYGKKDDDSQADETPNDTRKVNDGAQNDSDESTKNNLIESNESAGSNSGNCEESSNVEDKVNKESISVETDVNDQLSNADVNDKLSNEETSVTVGLSNAGDNINDELSNTETDVNDDSSIERTNVTEGLSNADTCVNEGVNNAEDNVNERLSKAEDNVNEQLSNTEDNVNEELSNALTNEIRHTETDVNEEISNTSHNSSAEKTVTEESNVESNASDESNLKESLSSTVSDNYSNRLDDENEKVDRIDMEIDNPDNCKGREVDASLQNIGKEESTRGLDTPVNGVSHDKESMEVDRPDNKTEEIKQIKDSPIKHSIENLIGETDKNPDKYINEVISSIENIIMNNRADEKNQENGQENEINDKNLMDALDEQIGERNQGDSDKISLEDLLPKHNRHEELEDISDDDFNFDA